MRILGVDYGQKRIGLAISDETEMLATSLEYLPAAGLDKAVAAVADMAQRQGAGKIVVGLPSNLKGEDTAQTGRTRQFIEKLEGVSAVPVERWDERFTSAQAERVLIEGGVRRQQRREKIDQLAAQLMLQGYLDAHAQR